MDNKNTIFYSYWVSTTLPSITNLHFKSFLYYHPNSTYELWLDSDISTSIDHPDLNWVKYNDKIIIKYFSLNEAINRLILNRDSKSKLPTDSFIKKILRGIHKKFLYKFIDFGLIDNDVIGISYKHSSPIFQGYNDLVYRSDIARLLIPLMMYGDRPSLYIDLDLCFTSNMLDLCGSEPFSYWWEDGKFINSAILYTPNHDTRKALLEIGRDLQSFRPWTLYSANNCQKISMVIYSSEIFDPLWTKKSKLYGNSLRFFNENIYIDDILKEINLDAYRAIHWHNNWYTIPTVNSVYSSLLKKYSYE